MEKSTVEVRFGNLRIELNPKWVKALGFTHSLRLSLADIFGCAYDEVKIDLDDNYPDKLMFSCPVSILADQSETQLN